MQETVQTAVDDTSKQNAPGPPAAPEVRRYSATARSPVGFEAAYFSFITLTASGYGDIVPVVSIARMLAMLEAMAGTFYVAILIARLVSLYSSPPPGETS
jgi:hypothetical protein